MVLLEKQITSHMFHYQETFLQRSPLSPFQSCLLLTMDYMIEHSHLCSGASKGKKNKNASTRGFQTCLAVLPPLFRKQSHSAPPRKSISFKGSNRGCLPTSNYINSHCHPQHSPCTPVGSLTTGRSCPKHSTS